MAHRRTHGPEHQNGGVDELNVGDLSGVLADRQDADKLQGRDVQDTAPSGEDVLIWSTANSRWEPGPQSGGGGGTYGSLFQEESSDEESSYSGNSWVEKVSLQTPSLPAGKYRIAWSFELVTSSSCMTGYARVQLNNTDDLGEFEARVIPESGWFMMGGFKYEDLSAGTHFIDLDYSSSGNGNKVTYIRRARLEFWRVS